MQFEELVRKKRDEAYTRYDHEEKNPAEKKYCETVAWVLDWVLGEDDDPFMDSEPLD